MTKKIFRSILVAVISVLLISLLVITGVMYSRFSKVSEKQFDSNLFLLAQGMEETGAEYLSLLSDESYRITWIDADGTVLYDNQIDTDSMDNHADREEVIEAIEHGVGESARYSDTLTERTVYCAKRLSDGTILRISTRFDSFFILFINILIPMTFVVALAVIISVLVARRMAKSIVKPLNELDLDSPEGHESYEELSPIITKLNKQHSQISTQMKLLKRRSDEFEQITESMNEGLVLLDKNGCVFSINPAAKKLFFTPSDPIGQKFLDIDPSTETKEAVFAAFNGESREFFREKNGRAYRITISRTSSEGKTIGAVILCVDITEAYSAEQSRREFTANVSHELKTPLQSIIGSAELLQNGLVKPEDTQRFVGHIKNEAERLVSLISDIIRLSQLDENNEIPFEDVDLYDTAQTVISDLSPTARAKGIKMNLAGETCAISGVRSYIYEIIYNLLDNAIRYNKEGGTVNVSVLSDGSFAKLTVSDTGIGIEEEHLSRLFERFYRVDKSHSKETGGTGLGLSIVKHAVSYHKGQTEIKSKIGKGTTVTVTLPCKA